MSQRPVMLMVSSHRTLATLVAGDIPALPYLADTAVATDPGDIADPSVATAEDVAIAYNALLANLRSAGLIA